MTLAELMAEIQEKYAHSLSDASVIRKLDALQKRIFRVLKRVVTTQVVTAPGQIWFEPKYRTTDPTVRPGDIREFHVDGVAYNYQDLSEYADTKYYFYVNGKYGVVPQPQANTTIVVFHYYTPATLTTSSTAVEIDEDFQNVLIYGMCKEIAENFQDFDAANGYAIQYNDFLDELLKYSKPVVPHTIQEEWWG